MDLQLNQGTVAWYCWQAQPKREHLSSELVRIECGLETYCPRLRYDKKTARGIVKWVEPLFPGYLFIRGDLGLNFRRILATGGITRLVTVGTHVPTLDDNFIEGLKTRLAAVQQEVDQPDLKENDEVTIAFGPFSNFKAVVKGQIPARQRVRVLLEFLGQPIQIDVPREVLLRPKPAINNQKL